MKSIMGRSALAAKVATEGQGKMKKVSGRMSALVGMVVLLFSLTMVPAMLTPRITEASESNAQALTLTLERLSLDNADDAAGTWQHEGGRVLCPDGMHIANYAAYRRVTFSGTSPQNTAMLTMTLFFIGEVPPHNITLQGAHHFQSGEYSGSVSAASSEFAALRDESFSGQAGAIGTLTIRNLGHQRVNPCQ